MEHIHLVGPDVMHDDLEITAPRLLTKPWKTTIAAGRSPVLTLGQIGTANATTGLNLVILHYCQRNWNFAAGDGSRLRLARFGPAGP